MNKIVSILIAISFSVCILLNCNKSGSSPTDGTTSDPVTPAFVGSWQFPLPPILNILTDTMHLNLTMDTNHTYKLEVIERTDKTLFSSNGTWESIPDATIKSVPDSVRLIGEQCKMLDTSATPDTLKIMSEADCSTPIVLSAPKASDAVWLIKTSSLSVPLSVLPINQTQLLLVISVVQTLPLTKVEK